MRYEDAHVIARALCARNSDQQNWVLSLFKYDVDACAISAHPLMMRAILFLEQDDYFDYFMDRYSSSKFEKVSSIVVL